MSPLPPARLPARKRSSGFTLLELLVSITILTVSVGMTGSTIVTVSNYAHAARENSLARAALAEQVQTLRAYPFEDLFRDHNSTAADDGPGAPGPAFDVDGLNPQEGDPDGRVGRIEFPEDPTNAFSLREDLGLPQLGMPADLNADGTIDGTDKSGDYRILPVRLVVEWDSRSGRSRVTAETVLGSW